ncbi:hypothetical protein [Aliicoccus persicus]|uniref:Asparagine synthase n=1 Tax=Aliicoccus persicus TaxID=930138 RepID=A0A662Z3D6_9STAP|nr:hypothetical protein [Aliicoccus persicus]SEV79725.1 hypothetical protein SAMN05192557_0017 [Aliicoccus persicus]
MNLRLYPFGYILSDKKLDSLPPNYVNKEVIDEYYYYTDSGTQYSISKNKDSFLIIHGDYMHIGIYNNIPNNLIAETLLSLYLHNHEEFLNTLDYLAGRYSIIIKDSNKIKIYPDATNGRSNYYCMDQVLVSSHANLLGEILNYKIPEGEVKIVEKTFLNSPYDNVKSTIPNHYVELPSNNVTRFFPRRNNPYTQMSEEKRFALVEKFWKTQIEEYCQYYNKIVFSITGGLDSRFALALSKNYIDRFNFFTYAYNDKIDNSTSESSKLSLDYTIVKNILNDIHLNHKFFFFHDDPLSLTDKESEIQQKNSIHRHLPILNKYVYNAFGENLLHLRSNTLEIGQARLHRKEKIISSIPNAKESVMKMYKGDTIESKLLEKSYNDFVSNINYLSNIYDYHVLDLIHWELRVGRWISEVLNNHDSVFRTINPFSHRAMNNISLSFSYEQRRDCYLFKEIINRNFPILNFYGVNDYNNLYEQSKKKNSVVSKTVNKNSIKTIFNEFLVKSNDQSTVTKSVTQNNLFLPRKLNKKGSYVEASITFERENGIAQLVITSPYSSREYKEYIYYEIYKNDELLLKEDIANWARPNHISIPGLIKNDIIKIRLQINKDLLQKENWESNSRLQILEYREITSKMSDRNLIHHSSPYSRKNLK